MDGRTDGWIDDRWMDGQMNGWMDDRWWMDGHMDGRTDLNITVINIQQSSTN